MTAKEYIKIVEDKRDLLAEIMIAGMKEWDKGSYDGYYELYIDLSSEDLNPEWEYWPDNNSSRYTGDSDVMPVLKIGPRGSWTDWYADMSIEEIAEILDIRKEDLTSVVRAWLEREEYIDVDDAIDTDHIILWLDSNPDEEIARELIDARADSIDRELEDVYSDWADGEIEELMRRLGEMARDEEEQEAERAAWARGEVRQYADHT